jgi:hypothetical protein
MLFKKSTVLTNSYIYLDKGNNKITELRTIFQRESQNKFSQQPEHWENVMTLTWYRHFQRNGGLNQILKRQTSRFHFGSKVHFVLISSVSLENTPVNGLYFHWKMSLSFLCSAIGGSCAF